MNSMRAAIDDGVLAELLHGNADRGAIRQALAISDSELTAAIRRLRDAGLAKPCDVKLTAKGLFAALWRIIKGGRRGLEGC